MASLKLFRLDRPGCRRGFGYTFLKNLFEVRPCLGDNIEIVLSKLIWEQLHINA